MGVFVRMLVAGWFGIGGHKCTQKGGHIAKQVVLVWYEAAGSPGGTVICCGCTRLSRRERELEMNQDDLQIVVCVCMCVCD